ncbi:MAG: hypothetical protein ACE5I5_03700 [Candidatus Heimdallarchaeota archaeon]
MGESDVLIEAAIALVRFVAVGIWTFKSRCIAVLIAYVDVEIPITFECLVTIWMWTRKSFGLVKVVDVFEMI